MMQNNIVKAVWECYKRGMRKSQVCELLQITEQQSSDYLNIAQKEYGKPAKPFIPTYTPDPPQKDNKRPKAEYSNPDYSKIYL